MDQEKSRGADSEYFWMTLQRAHVKRLIEVDVLCDTKQVLQGFYELTTWRVAYLKSRISEELALEQRIYNT